MNNCSIDFVIALIALVLSGINSIIYFYNYILRPRPKLRVRITATQQFELPEKVNINGRTIATTLEPIVQITITNFGEVPRNIETLILNFHGFKVNNNSDIPFFIHKNEVSFPYELLSGKQFNYPIDANRITSWVSAKQQSNLYFRIIVIDTCGKRFVSNKLFIRDVIDMVNKAQKYKEQYLEL
jgi:hypothetical protein